MFVSHIKWTLYRLTLLLIISVIVLGGCRPGPGIPSQTPEKQTTAVIQRTPASTTQPLDT